MALPSTENQILFVTRLPAWERDVEITWGMATQIFLSRGGLEQRTQQRSRATVGMKYEAVMNGEAANARELRIAVEVRAALWVPVWPFKSSTTSAITSDVVEIGTPATLDLFAPGDYLYFLSDALGGQFRLITATDGRELTLEADGEAIDFPEGTAVYPCRLFIRSSGEATTERLSEESVVETLDLYTL